MLVTALHRLTVMSPYLTRLQRDRANIAAVGSFEPGIELWDMDVVSALLEYGCAVEVPAHLLAC